MRSVRSEDLTARAMSALVRFTSSRADDGKRAHSRHRLGDDRIFRSFRIALRRKQGEHLDSSALDKRLHGVEHVHEDGHAPRHHVLLRGRAALVGHVHEVDARCRLQELHRQVHRGATTRRRVGELARILLRERNQLGDGVRLERGMRRHHQVLHRNLGDANEVLQRVVGKVGAQARIDDVGGDHRAEGVPVGRGLGDVLGADHGPRAGPVLDHHRLGPHFLHLRGHEAPDDIGFGQPSPAGRAPPRARGIADRSSCPSRRLARPRRVAVADLEIGNAARRDRVVAV